MFEQIFVVLGIHIVTCVLFGGNYAAFVPVAVNAERSFGMHFIGKRVIEHVDGYRNCLIFAVDGESETALILADRLVF